MSSTKPHTRQAMRRSATVAAGCCLLLLLASVSASFAAHEPDPILQPLDAEAQEDGAPGEQQLSAAGGAGAAHSNASSAQPPPHVATIPPLMPILLPGCPNDDILNSNKHSVFPKNWGGMTLSEQALHPINLVWMNFAGVSNTDLVPIMTPCLYNMGIVRGSVVKIVREYKVGNSMAMKTMVLVMRSKKAVYVLYRPTDDDWAADFDCMYTEDLRKKLNVPTPLLGAKKLQLHRGFWAAYLATDKQLSAEVNKQLRHVKPATPFGKPQVWLVGHSLAGALASITAFKLAHDPKFIGEIGGVVTFGSPRVGNEVWQQLYNEKLLAVSLRWHNHRDLFAALPANGQFCISKSPLKTVFSFRHVGRAALLCPSAETPGLQEFRFFPAGTEESCNTGEVLIIGSHLLGHYFDGWRRAYAQRYGLARASTLSGGTHVRGVMCSQCALAVKQYPLPDNKAARNDGITTCVTNASCASKDLFSVISWAGMFPTAFFRADALCDYATATCQVPSAALTQLQQSLMKLAPNVTSALGDMASKALANSPLSQMLGLGALLGGNGTAGANGTDSASMLPNAFAAMFANLTANGLPAAMNLWSEKLRESNGTASAGAGADEGAAEGDAGSAEGADAADAAGAGGDGDAAAGDVGGVHTTRIGGQHAALPDDITSVEDSLEVGEASEQEQDASSSSSSAGSGSGSRGDARMAAAEGMRAAGHQVADVLHRLSTVSSGMLGLLGKVRDAAAAAAAAGGSSSSSS